MNRKILTGMIILVMVITGAVVSAQENTGESPSPFIQQLTVQLRERDWSDEQIDALLLQTRLMAWKDVEGADAELIAYALSHAHENQAESSREQAREQARLVHELAAETLAMERLGYGRQDIASAAAGAVQSIQEQLRQHQPGSDSEPLGEFVRTAVRSTIRQQIARGERAGDLQQMVQLHSNPGRSPRQMGSRPGRPF
ncbi:MAG: hypothetical protein K9L73_06225 [Spirochaetia bacterium]|nr:hypothetical protein [Spirochaetia bacterium]